MTRRLLVAAVLLVLVAADVVLVLGAHSSSTRSEDRSEAIAAARARVPEMFSYASASLDADLDHAVAQTTGSFRAEFRNLLDTVVTPAAKTGQISTSAKVTAAGVVRSSKDTVVVLVFLTQTTTKAGAAPSATGSRVDVTMRHTSGRWLVADLATV
jgi:Mce-associated membrane protein